MQRPFREAVMDFFNLVAGSPILSKKDVLEYRKEYLLGDLLTKFECALSDDELSSLHRESDDAESNDTTDLFTLLSKEDDGKESSRVLLFQRLQELSGVRLSSQSLKELTNPDYFQFVLPDIQGLKTRVKRMNLVEYADGMALYFQSMSKSGRAQRHTQQRLLSLAHQRLQVACSTMGSNFDAG